jgi:hypothetical protein
VCNFRDYLSKNSPREKFQAKPITLVGVIGFERYLVVPHLSNKDPDQPSSSSDHRQYGVKEEVDESILVLGHLVLLR